MKSNSSSHSHAQPRLENPNASPAAWAGMIGLQTVVNGNGLDPLLLDLVKLRASQLNRCAYCIDLHVRDARQKGERDERLHLLPAWEEVDLYSPRERAALRWTEALTRLSEGTVSDAVYAEARAQFSEAELMDLTLTIVAINGWNRFNVAFRIPPDPDALRKIAARYGKETVAAS
ncbi:MAG TPA: carboxymuconolactone decarboxylase family protein [Opitutaceae bacterium]